eukprot:3586732-Heterocapsa_arctica.AAC.1
MGSASDGDPHRDVHQRWLPLPHVRDLADHRPRHLRAPWGPLGAAVGGHVGKPQEGAEGGDRGSQDRAGLLWSRGREVPHHSHPEGAEEERHATLPR